MTKRALLFFALIWGGSSASAMSVQDYLQMVQKRNRTVRALEVSAEAADDRMESIDIDLAPYMSAEANHINDRSPLSQFATLGSSEVKTTSYSLGLGKKFSSGTEVNLFASTYEVENSGMLPAFQQFSKFGVGSLGVSLSQSLWKDFFGRATRLRTQRQTLVTEAQKGLYDLQRKQLLVDAETAYWNYVYAQENLKIGRDSLERAQRLENWSRRRVNDGIMDTADLYAAQSLVAARQLQLVSAQDDLDAAKRQIRDFLELSDSEELPAITGNLSQKRNLISMVEGDKANARIVALGAYLASLESKAKSVGAQEVEDQLKPDLVLSGAYNTNAFEQDMASATQEWTDTDRPTQKIGLKFTYAFDVGAKQATREAAKKDALVAKLQSERKMLESESAWIELNRRYTEMSRRVSLAENLSSLMTKTAKAQTDLFNKGRAITATVLTAEEDAGNAELSLIKLKSEQRKMETQGRLFIGLEGEQP